MDDGQCQTVDIFGVAANPETFLTQSERILSFGYTGMFLEIGLTDIGRWRVDLYGKDSHIFILWCGV
jgi:hypothetical protein